MSQQRGQRRQPPSQDPDTFEHRDLSQAEVDAVTQEMEGLTDELVALLRNGDAIEGISKRIWSVQERHGVGVFLAAIIGATCSLVSNLLVLNGSVEGLYERLECGERPCLRPALRLAEAILAETAGLKGRIDPVLDELAGDPGFAEHDLASAIVEVWQAVVSIGARFGVAIASFVDVDDKVVQIGVDERCPQGPSTSD